jgi:septal ring factor EnvC (AmiA/AmiB activator)
VRQVASFRHPSSTNSQPKNKRGRPPKRNNLISKDIIQQKPETKEFKFPSLIKVLEDSVQSLQQEIERLKTAVNEKDISIGKLEAQLESSIKAMSDMRNQLNEINEHAAKLQATVDVMNSQLEEMTRQAERAKVSNTAQLEAMNERPEGCRQAEEKSRTESAWTSEWRTPLQRQCETAEKIAIYYERRALDLEGQLRSLAWHYNNNMAKLRELVYLRQGWT